MKKQKLYIPDLHNFLIKEYELCFNRASTIYDLTNEVIKLYTTIFFAVISVFGFTLSNAYSTIFNDNKLLPLVLLLGLILFGVVSLFMHISTWSARNYYRKRRKKIQEFLLGIYSEATPRDALLDYLTIPKYIDCGVLHSLSLYLWYFFYLMVCNWIAVVLLASIIFDSTTTIFYLIIISFLPFQWIIAELYVVAKKREHKKKSLEKRRKLEQYKGNFYKIMSNL